MQSVVRPPSNFAMLLQNIGKKKRKKIEEGKKVKEDSKRCENKYLRRLTRRTVSGADGNKLEEIRSDTNTSRVLIRTFDPKDQRWWRIDGVFFQRL